MSPTPAQIVAGVRKILADTIAPELVSEHARSRLAEIRAVLAQIDWDDAGFELVRQSRALAEQLRNAQQWMPEDLPAEPSEPNFDAYRIYHEQLASRAVDVLAALRAHVATEPADDEARTAYRALLGAV